MIEIPEDGYVSVRVGGAEYRVDAYRLWNLIVEARDRVADAGGAVREYHEAVVEILKGEGLPALNHFQADRFAAAMADAVDRLGKVPGPGPTPASPGSSAQPS